LAEYRVGFFDDERHVFDAIEIECRTDVAAIEEAHRLDVASITAGFEVWREHRLVHRHDRRKMPSTSETDTG